MRTIALAVLACGFSSGCEPAGVLQPTAVSRVVIRAMSEGSTQPDDSTVESVTGDLLSDDALRDAIGEAGPCAAGLEADHLRAQVSIDWERSPDGLSLLVRLADSDAHRAIALASALTRSYVARRTAREESQRAAAGRANQQAVERARSTWLESREQLDRFLETHFENPSWVEAAAGPHATAEPPQPPSETRPVENPEWNALEQQRRAAQRERDRLLVDRTPQHPEVLEATQRLEDLGRQLRGIPRTLERDTQAQSASPAAPRPGRGGIQVPTVETPSQIAKAEAEAGRQFRQLRDRVDGAEVAYQRALASAKQSEESSATKAVVVALPAVIAPSPGPHGGSANWLAALLCAGAAILAGAGFLTSQRASHAPTFASPEEVGKALNLPVLGVISGRPGGSLS